MGLKDVETKVEKVLHEVLSEVRGLFAPKNGVEHVAQAGDKIALDPKADATVQLVEAGVLKPVVAEEATKSEAK